MASDQRGSLPLLPAQTTSVHMFPPASATSWIRLGNGERMASSARVGDADELLGGGCPVWAASRGAGVLVCWGCPQGDSAFSGVPDRCSHQCTVSSVCVSHFGILGNSGAICKLQREPCAIGLPRSREARSQDSILWGHPALPRPWSHENSGGTRRRNGLLCLCPGKRHRQEIAVKERKGREESKIL